MQNIEPRVLNNQNQILSKAIINLQDFWQLSNKDLADIIGVDPSFITRLRQCKTLIEHDKKVGELSLMLIRVFRSLGAFLGDRLALQNQWLNSFNKAFNNKPIDNIKNISGLAHVVQYLDALRGVEG